MFAIQVLAVLAGSLTAGVGTAFVESWGFSQLGIAATSMIIQSSVNFTINETFDALMGVRTTETTILNLLFGITDIGSFGRAMKYDKLLKVLNQNEILSRIGINSKVKNFYEIKQALKYQDVIIRSLHSTSKTGIKKSFKKVVTDVEILQTILDISTIEMKKSIKIMAKNSPEQLKTFLEIEQLLYKINPRLLPTIKPINISNYNAKFRKTAKMDIIDFFKLDDEQAFKTLSLFDNLKFGIGNESLAQISRLRMHSKFQQSLFDNFKTLNKSIKRNLKKINPFTYLDKIINKMMEPIIKSMDKIAEKSMKYFSKVNKTFSKTLKRYNLIPCQPKSYLLGFRFTPTTPTGEGYIEIWKKPYFWKTQPGRVSNYNKVRTWTNLKKVEQFALATDQNQFYEENWGLGRGYSQSSNKLINVLSPGLAKLYRDINKVFRNISITKTILKSGITASLKTYSNKRIGRIFNKNQNKLLTSPFRKIPGLNLFAPSFADLITGKGWNNQKAFNNTVKKSTIKKARKVKVIYV